MNQASIEKYHIYESNSSNTREMRCTREIESKLKFYMEGKTAWQPEKPANYMKTLTRKQASTIFKARTRMTRIKGNYKNEYPDQTCRACKKHPETHIHVLDECEVLNPNASTSTKHTEIFCEDAEPLKKIASDIDKLCEQLLSETN